MSSTKRDESEAAIRDFCEKVFRPAAEQVAKEGRSFFAHAPDSAATSYYTRRERTSMRREDFETPSFRTAEAFAEELAAMWRSQGLASLCTVTPAMAALAKQLQQVEEQSDEVSPFVYVMF